jgi:hypothetical protein
MNAQGKKEAWFLVLPLVVAVAIGVWAGNTLTSFFSFRRDDRPLKVEVVGDKLPYLHLATPQPDFGMAYPVRIVEPRAKQ